MGVRTVPGYPAGVDGQHGVERSGGHHRQVERQRGEAGRDESADAEPVDADDPDLPRYVDAGQLQSAQDAETHHVVERDDGVDLRTIPHDRLGARPSAVEIRCRAGQSLRGHPGLGELGQEQPRPRAGVGAIEYDRAPDAPVEQMTDRIADGRPHVQVHPAVLRDRTPGVDLDDGLVGETVATGGKAGADEADESVDLIDEGVTEELVGGRVRALTQNDVPAGLGGQTEDGRGEFGVVRVRQVVDQQAEGPRLRFDQPTPEP